MQTVDITYQEHHCNGLLFANPMSTANVLISPAMGVTAKYYTNFARWLSEQGLHVLVIDYAGTGMSENRIREPLTLMDWIRNIEMGGKWLSLNSPDKPLIFLGHSIGSQLFGFLSETELFDRAVFIASSTGYWRDGHSPQKWINYLLLNTVMPFSNFVWGYTNSKLFKQGENYPKKPALQWRKWCLNKEYLRISLDEQQKNNYNNYGGIITSLWFSDDQIANEITAGKLLDIYKNAKTHLVRLSPNDFNSRKIGHTGFLSRKFSANLWPEFLTYLKD